jgi:hypothetical protein
MSDSRTKIRRWGLDHAQLRAELELIREQYPNQDDFDQAAERLFAEFEARQAYHKRTHEPEPPKWE